MKIIRNSLIPFRGFKGINLFGWLFVRQECGELSETDINHESIHTAQMKELAYLPFYIAYLVEWLWHLSKTRNAKRAYYMVSHEREAYAHQSEPNYLSNRKHYSQFKQPWH